MQGVEIQLRSMGISGMAGTYGPRDHEARKQAMRVRARAAEIDYRDREAWEHRRRARPVRSRRYRQLVQGTVGAAAMAVVLVLFLLPAFLR